MGSASSRPLYQPMQFTPDLEESTKPNTNTGLRLPGLPHDVSHKSIKEGAARYEKSLGKVDATMKAVEDQYDADYGGDPHVACLAALQYYDCGPERKAEEDMTKTEQEKVKDTWKTFFRLIVCQTLQFLLMKALLSSHVGPDDDPELRTPWFLVTCFVAWCAFVAETTQEWREILHLTEMLQSWKECGIGLWTCVVFDFLPKVGFAIYFTFQATWLFLDAANQTEIILNCTSLMFFLQVDNKCFQASGGKLHQSHLKILVENVQDVHFRLPPKHFEAEAEEAEEALKKYEEKYETHRNCQTIQAFVLTSLISMGGAIYFWFFIAGTHSATTM